MLRRRGLALASALSSILLTSVSAVAQDCTGTGFWAAESLEAYDSPRATVIGDFNRDGRADLVVSIFHGNQVRVFLGKPDGPFSARSYGVGYQPDKLVAGDVDGDSDLDLVVINTFDRTFTVLKNDGTGLFTVTQTLGLGFSFGDIALGDLDGDGDLDLVAVGSASTTKEVQVFLNTGGTFAWSRDYAVAGVPVSLVLGQFDGDGALDVAVAASDDSSVSILWNGGAGVLSAPVRLATLVTPWKLVAGDVDGDGRIDLLTAHSAAGQVGILAKQSGRSFAPVRTVTTGVRTSTLAVGDLDRDGDLDLVVTGDDPSPAVDGASILLNTGTGDFTASGRFDVGEGPLAITLGDLDGDGDLDVVSTDQGSNSIRLFTNRDGRMTVAHRTDLGGTSGVQGIAHGDLNGDGRPELIVAQRTQIQVLREIGAGVSATPVPYPAGTSVSGVAAGDVDGDGDIDVVVADDTTDDIAVLRNTAGVLSAPVRFPACDGARAVALEDMDGDGDLDGVVACLFANSVKVLRNNGAGSFASWTGWGWGGSAAGPQALAVGDLDGDGDRDIVVALGNSNMIAVLRNDGGFFPLAWSDTGCTAPESIALGDVNGDGRLDIAVSCRLAARVRIYLNAGGGTFTPGATPLVIAPLTVKLADMDGDGNKDLVVVRGNTNSVAVLAGDGAGHFAPARDVAADADPWFMVVVDWDGDADLDVATGGYTTRASTAVLNTTVGCPASAALSVTGGSVAEGDVGAASLSFLVTLSTPVSWPVTVDYATANGTATAVSDYEAASGTLTFVPGETQKTVVVTVFGDAAVEPDEAFWLNLSDPAGAPVQTAQAAGTIVDDDLGTTAPLALDLTSLENGEGGVTMIPEAYACSVAGGASQHCDYDFSIGATVTLVPEAAYGSAFLGWTGACTGTGPCVVTVTEALQVGASFLGPRTLTVQVTSVEGGRGTVSLSPAPLGPPGGSCDNVGAAANQVCTFQYPPDTVVTMAVSAHPDSKFQGWSGACTGTEPCQVLLSLPGPGELVEASFLGPRTLTVQVTSVEGGRGTVSLSPAPLGPPGGSCDNVGAAANQVCTFQYPPDTVVTMAVSAHPDSKFQGWSGACTGTEPCQVLLSLPGPGELVEASFLGPRTLTVQVTSVEGGRGTVSLSPAPLGPPGGSCDNVGAAANQACTFQYPPDTVVTMAVSAHPDSKFLGWSGACTGTEPCQVLLSLPGPGELVGASFLGPRTLTVQVTSVEGGRGTVSLSPAPLGPPGGLCDNLGGAPNQVCTFQYPPDTAVTLTGLAQDDSALLGWSGVCTGAAPCQVLLSGPGPGPLTEATFRGPQELALSIVSSHGGRGSLTVQPASVRGAEVCALPQGAPNAACAFPYAPGTVVTVMALPEPGSVVRSLDGSCPPAGPCTITMSGVASVVAVFEIPNRAPTAVAGGPYTGVRGQAIVFDGSASTDPDGDTLAYRWSFGDGATASGVSPLACLRQPRDFRGVSRGERRTVELDAGDDLGHDLEPSSDGDPDLAGRRLRVSRLRADPAGRRRHRPRRLRGPGRVLRRPSEDRRGPRPAVCRLVDGHGAGRLRPHGPGHRRLRRDHDLRSTPGAREPASDRGSRRARERHDVRRACRPLPRRDGVGRRLGGRGRVLPGQHPAGSGHDSSLRVQLVQRRGGTVRAHRARDRRPRRSDGFGAGHRRRRDGDGGRRGQLRPGRGQRQHQLRQLVGAAGPARDLRKQPLDVSPVQPHQPHHDPGGQAAPVRQPERDDGDDRTDAGLLFDQPLLGRELDHLEQQAGGGRDGPGVGDARERLDDGALVRVGPHGVPPGGEGGGPDRGHPRPQGRRGDDAICHVPLTAGLGQPSGAADHTIE